MSRRRTLHVGGYQHHSTEFSGHLGEREDARAIDTVVVYNQDSH
jgi:hypothetical protein